VEVHDNSYWELRNEGRGGVIDWVVVEEESFDAWGRERVRVEFGCRDRTGNR
jgi:hypothetical protein